VRIARKVLRLVKGLSNQFFTFLPECLGVVWIERITAHAFVYAHGQAVRHEMAHVAVLAVLAADLVSRSNDSRPH
jgi:hypothetical protein